ncbi:hypothetical protein GPALN_010782 [Globodera pallida]|nr:hypothetical protein GPALN_010782 [Globodera pallida]
MANMANDASVLVRAIRTGEGEQSAESSFDLVNNGIISVISLCLESKNVMKLLKSSNTAVNEQFAWILADICAGTSEQTRVVVESDAIFPLMCLLVSMNLYCVCKPVLCTLDHIISGSTAHKVMNIVIRGMFDSQNANELLEKALEALSTLISRKERIQQSENLKFI